jgi:hypothetical protein
MVLKGPSIAAPMLLIPVASKVFSLATVPAMPRWGCTHSSCGNWILALSGTHGCTLCTCVEYSTCLSLPCPFSPWCCDNEKCGLPVPRVWGRMCSYT